MTQNIATLLAEARPEHQVNIKSLLKHHLEINGQSLLVNPSTVLLIAKDFVLKRHKSGPGSSKDVQIYEMTLQICACVQ